MHHIELRLENLIQLADCIELDYHKDERDFGFMKLERKDPIPDLILGDTVCIGGGKILKVKEIEEIRNQYMDREGASQDNNYWRYSFEPLKLPSISEGSFDGD